MQVRRLPASDARRLGGFLSVFGATLCVAVSFLSIIGVPVPPWSSSCRFLGYVVLFECLSCRELFASVRNALRLLRSSRFRLDLVHDLVGRASWSYTFNA